jgi:hypothetical protein
VPCGVLSAVAVRSPGAQRDLGPVSGLILLGQEELDLSVLEESLRHQVERDTGCAYAETIEDSGRGGAARRGTRRQSPRSGPRPMPGDGYGVRDTGRGEQLSAGHGAMVDLPQESSKVSSWTGPPGNNLRLLRMKLAGIFPEWLT